MAAEQAVVTSFRALDRVSATMGKMAGAVKRFGKVSEDSFSRASKSSSRFADIVKGSIVANVLVNAVSAVARSVYDFAKSSITLASDLMEVQNVVDTTFGPEGSKKINEWADRSMKAFGISTLQAKQFTGSMGAMLKSSGITGDNIINMSTGLAGLAGDFASFYNLPHDVAWEKIRSGISGETEPLKQLGINMSVANLEAFALTKGITKQWKAMTQAEQVQLRYNYLMEKSADASGDFSDTLKTSMANQLRVFQTNLKMTGAAVFAKTIPVFTKVLDIVNGLFERIDTSILADNVAAGLEFIVQTAKSIFTIVQPYFVKLFALFQNVGASMATMNWEPIIKALKIVVALFGIAIDVIQVLWAVAKPIIDGILWALNPVMDLITSVVGALGKLTSYFSGKATGKDGKDGKPADKTIQAPNQNQAAATKNSMNVNVSTNVNAPQGYKVDTTVKSRPVSGNLGANK